MGGKRVGGKRGWGKRSLEEKGKRLLEERVWANAADEWGKVRGGGGWG